LSHNAGKNIRTAVQAYLVASVASESKRAYLRRRSVECYLDFIFWDICVYKANALHDRLNQWYGEAYKKNYNQRFFVFKNHFIDPLPYPTFYSPCLVSLSDLESPRLAAAAALQAIDIIAFASFTSDHGAHSP
jgi:hypothetical protein